MTRPFVFAIAGVVLIAAGWYSHAFGVDQAVAMGVYQHFDGFPRNAFFLKSVMHEGVRALAIAAFAALAIVLLADAVRPQAWMNGRRISLRIFFIVGGIFIGGIAALKSYTTLSCPWDLAVFGGTRPVIGYGSIFDVAGFGKGHCFPAGHSTSGYVWMALAFVFARTQRSLVYGVLALLPLGLCLSTVQILRGAHFLSHELTTLGIALIIFSCLPAMHMRLISAGRGRAHA